MPRFRRNAWWTSERHIHILLNKFAESKATNPRDKVYALLGMSEDAHDSERFYPCYEKVTWRSSETRYPTCCLEKSGLHPFLPRVQYWSCTSVNLVGRNNTPVDASPAGMAASFHVQDGKPSR